MFGGIVYWSPGPENDVACTLDVQMDDTAPDAERLLLSRLALERRVPVLGATLVREQHELFRAHAVGVDVDDDLQSDLVEPAQTEIRDLDLLALVRRQHDAGRVEHGRRPLARLGLGHLWSSGGSA